MLNRLRKWLAGNVEVSKPVGAQMLFYEDGSAEIHTTRGFVLTAAQNEAMREFMLDQMDEALAAFENTRQRARFLDERVIPFPMSKELN